MINKNSKCSLREIDPHNKKDISAITQMHMDLLSFGEMAQLGRFFLKRFCYGILLRDNLMKVALCEVEGKPAGFIAYTAYSITFHRKAIKKHWMSVSLLIILSIFRNPLVLYRLRKALSLLCSRRAEINHMRDPFPEILAIGVLPEYRTPQFIHRTGLRLSEELFTLAISYFKSLGLKKMYLFVDDFNKPTLLFYHQLGGRIRPYKRGLNQGFQIFFELCQYDKLKTN